MNYSKNLTIPVVLTGKPNERTWETENQETGEKRSGSVHVIRGYVVPENPETDPSNIQEIEFSIQSNKAGVAKKNVVDVMDTYYENKAKLAKGEVFVEVEAYMGGRRNKSGTISYFSPWVHDMKIVNVNEETKSNVRAVINKLEQF